MTVIDYLLVFPDQATAMAVLPPASDTLSIVVIGTIYADVETVDEDGATVLEKLPMDGWHVNAYSASPLPELEPYRVYPKRPRLERAR